MGLIKWFKRTFLPKPPPPPPGEVRYDEEVIIEYRQAGVEFGDVVSYIYMGECIGFDKMLARWEEAEREYAELGYRTISLDDFVSAGGYGKDLPVEEPRRVGEAPVFHAAYYREHFLGKNMMVSVEPVGDSGAFTGQYVMPSTKHLNEE